MYLQLKLLIELNLWTRNVKQLILVYYEATQFTCHLIMPYSLWKLINKSTNATVKKEHTFHQKSPALNLWFLLLSRNTCSIRKEHTSIERTMFTNWIELSHYWTTHLYRMNRNIIVRHEILKAYRTSSRRNSKCAYQDR